MLVDLRVSAGTDVNAVYLFLYRSYAAVKQHVFDRALTRSPRAKRGWSAATAFVRRNIFRSRETWVQVRSGLAQGLWMHLRVPEEAGFWRGEHEPDVQRQIGRIARPGQVIYDIGAHLGSLALGAARIVGGGSSGRVVAFEADPDTFARLEKNSARNQLQQALRPVHAALWSRTEGEVIGFRRGEDNRSQGGVEADGQHPVLAGTELIQVPVITLDQFIAEGNPPPRLLKVDVEGGECEVLRGGSKLFDIQRPLLIVEVHHQSACDWLNAWLEDRRYSGKWRIPPEGFPRYLFAWPSESMNPFVD